MQLPSLIVILMVASVSFAYLKLKCINYRLLKIGLLIIVLPLGLGFVDYGRTIRSEAPLFSFELGALADGGSSIFIGWGYEILFWHRNIAAPDDNGILRKIGYKTGPRLTFWFGLGRENSWFEPVQRKNIEAEKANK